MDSSELIFSWLKIIAALPIVLLLAYLSFRLSRGYMKTLRKGEFLKVVETVPVFSKSAVSIVQVGDRYLVVGISEQGIHLLTELTEEEAAKMQKKNKDISINPSAFFALKDKFKNVNSDWRQDQK